MVSQYSISNCKSQEMDFALKQSDAENLFIINGFRDCDYVQVINDLLPELKEQPRGELNCPKYPCLKRVFFLGGEKHRGMLLFLNQPLCQLFQHSNQHLSQLFCNF